LMGSEQRQCGCAKKNSEHTAASRRAVYRASRNSEPAACGLLHIFTNSRRAPRRTARRGLAVCRGGHREKWSREGRKFPAAGQEDEQGGHWEKNFWASMGETRARCHGGSFSALRKKEQGAPWLGEGRGGRAAAGGHGSRCPCVGVLLPGTARKKGGRPWLEPVHGKAATNSSNGGKNSQHHGSTGNEGAAALCALELGEGGVHGKVLGVTTERGAGRWSRSCSMRL
jgi:hypothetical protein